MPVIQNGIIVDYKLCLAVDGIRATVYSAESHRSLLFSHSELWLFLQASGGKQPFFFSKRAKLEQIKIFTGHLIFF